MDKEFNKKVFESFPDSVWTGKVPGADYTPRRTNVLKLVFETVAAACIVFTVITLLRKQPREAEPQVRAVQSEIVYTVNNAVRANMVLPDSTVVILNCGSRIKLDPYFGKTNRIVYLDGEALFDVRRERTMPFIINTPQGVEVKVTGTKFNLSCYSDNTLAATESHVMELVSGVIPDSCPELFLMMISLRAEYRSLTNCSRPASVG